MEASHSGYCSGLLIRDSKESRGFESHRFRLRLVVASAKTGFALYDFGFGETLSAYVLCVCADL